MEPSPSLPSEYAVEEVADLAGLESLRSAWDDLLAASPDADFFVSHEWVTTLIEHRWKMKPMRILAVRSGDEVKGIAPLVPDVGGNLWCRGSLVVPVMRPGIRCGILASEPSQPVIEAMIAHLTRVDGDVRLYVRARADSQAVEALRTVGRRFSLEAAVIPFSTRPVVELNGGWDEYLRSRQRHVRSELKRKIHRLEDAGSLRFTTARTPAECDAAMAEVLRVEERSWKELEGGSIPVSGVAAFYRDVVLRAAARGWMRIHLLHLDSVPIAHLFGVAYRNQMVAMKTAYDEAYARLSPGIVLVAKILQQAQTEGIRELDFLGVSARWKREFATATRHDVGACFYPKGSFRCRCCSEYRLHLKPYLRRTLSPFRRNGEAGGVREARLSSQARRSR